MSIRLLTQILDECPPGLLNNTDRMLLVSLAELTDEQTGKAIAPAGENVREILLRRTQLSVDGFTKACRRLAVADLEVRVPIGFDKHGKPRFAQDGTASNYRLPSLRARLGGRALEDQWPPPEAATEDREPAKLSGEPAPEAGLSTPESPPARAGLVPSDVSPTTRAREALPSGHAEAVEDLVVRLDADEQDAVDCVAQIAATKMLKKSLVAYVSKFRSRDDVLKHALARRRGGSSGNTSPPKCRHGRVNGMGKHGMGENVSRICPKCEVELPAIGANDFLDHAAGERDSA